MQDKATDAALREKGESGNGTTDYMFDRNGQGHTSGR